MAAVSLAAINCWFILGTAIAAMMRMMAITISSSMSEKPRRRLWMKTAGARIPIW